MVSKLGNIYRKGVLIVLSGPSGTGKGTIVRKLLNFSDKFKLSVSITTRSPRDGEVNGREYYFAKRNDFIKMIENSEFLEHAEYCGNFYGTPKSNIKDLLEKGYDVILEIEIEGGIQVKDKYPDAIGVFVVPPSIKALKDRLVSRGLDAETSINERLKRAEYEMKHAGRYDYVVVNDLLDDCVNDIIKIVDSEHMKSKQMNFIIDEVLKNE